MLPVRARGKQKFAGVINMSGQKALGCSPPPVTGLPEVFVTLCSRPIKPVRHTVRKRAMLMRRIDGFTVRLATVLSNLSAQQRLYCWPLSGTRRGQLKSTVALGL